MLNELELTQYFQKHNVSAAAQAYVRNVMTDDPSRRTGLYAKKSRPCAYYSRKMGFTIQAESENPEYLFAVLSEYLRKRLIYLDQPNPLSITTTSENGRKWRGLYTPDYLVLDDDGPALIECKSAADAYELVKTRPNDWKEEGGVFTFLPAVIAAQAYGIVHKVFTPEASTELLVSNLALLLQSRLYPQPHRDELLQKVKKAFMDDGFLTLKALWERCQLDSLCPLLQLIDQQVLFGRLSDDSLNNHESALIATCEEYLPFAEKLAPDLRSIGVDKLPKENALERALNNKKRLESRKAPKRTLSYWQSKIEKIKEKGGSAFTGLVPAWDRSGNWGSKIKGIRLEFIQKFIADKYPENYKKLVKRSHEEYIEAAKKYHPHEDPIGIEAFTRRVNSDPVARAAAIGGKRAENQAQPSTDVADRTLRPGRAFELAHIDHHDMDLHLCIKVNGKKLFTIRVWLTVMVDAFSECVLAFWVSSKAPSRRACAMVLRRCLRVHGRLPENIITDRGKEFESVYYSALLAFCGICKKERPAGHSRFGSEAERLFQLFINYYITTRPGRIRSIIETRGISRSHSSEATAQLTPELFIDEVTGFFEWYNTVNIINRAAAPRLTTLNENATLYGCCGVPTEYDQRFIIASAIDFNDYTIDVKRGINTSNGWYFDAAICELAGKRATKLTAREDPEFPHLLYVLIGTRWVTFRHTLDKLFYKNSQTQQLAAAIRFLDGRSAKEAQRAYANGELAGRMKNYDEILSGENTREKRTIETQEPPPSVPNVFAQARQRKLNPITTTSRRAS